MTENHIADLHRALVRLQLLGQARFLDNLRLIPHGAKFFSQGDEDGIVAEVFRRIGVANRFFVEIGIGDGSENNTLHLLLNGWKGIWIDGWAEGVARARASFAPWIEGGRLTVLEANVMPGDIDAILKQAGAPEVVDLFALDIDGNDAHVFEAVTTIRPRAAILEYNASLGPTARWAMPFDASHRWDETLVFGASLATLAELADGKGMDLVGCNLSGTNAFFVSRGEDLSRFRKPFTATEHYEPPRYYLLPMHGGHRAPEDSRLAQGLLEDRPL